MVAEVTGSLSPTCLLGCVPCSGLWHQPRPSWGGLLENEPASGSCVCLSAVGIDKKPTMEKSITRTSPQVQEDEGILAARAPCVRSCGGRCPEGRNRPGGTAVPPRTLLVGRGLCPAASSAPPASLLSRERGGEVMVLDLGRAPTGKTHFLLSNGRCWGW